LLYAAIFGHMTTIIQQMTSATVRFVQFTHMHIALIFPTLNWYMYIVSLILDITI
jgi:hypothetical protein